jgi:hypothetical protein
VDDTLIVSGGQLLGDRDGDVQDLIDREPTFWDKSIERLALD